ncbi:MAG: helix-turn-helix domain-containing protein [Gammaproteobacteria bacterium]
MPPGHPAPVRVLVRGLEIMALLNREGPLNTAAISQRLRLARTTVNRCLATLEAEGYAERLPTRGFALTLKARTLSHGFDAVTERLQPVRRALHAAAVEMRWPMSLMRLQHPEMLIEDSTDRESGFAVEYFERGMRVPVLTTASGRAVLAFAAPRARETLIDLLWPTRAPELHDLWPDRPALERELAVIRERGHARAVRPMRITEQGSIAVPVLLEGEAVAAVAVRFALSAVPFEEARKRMLPILSDIALGKARR